MSFSEKDYKLFETIGMRASYGLIMHKLLPACPSFICLAADTSTSGGLDRVRKDFPNQYVECGIAEQNMILVAAGLASEGHLPFVSTFAPFLTLRPLEMIRHCCGYMKLKMILVGLASGNSLKHLGETHCCSLNEDIKVMSAIPNLNVFQPSSPSSLVGNIYSAIESNNPSYIRLVEFPKT